MSDRLMDERLAALRRCEEEVALLGSCAEQLRQHIEPKHD